MSCEVIQNAATGTTFFVCGGRRVRKLCKFCGKFYATLLCDAPTGNGKTCDAPICPACAINGGPDIDYCQTTATSNRFSEALNEQGFEQGFRASV